MSYPILGFSLFLLFAIIKNEKTSVLIPAKDRNERKHIFYSENSSFSEKTVIELSNILSERILSSL